MSGSVLRAVDTNVLVRLVVQDDTEQSKAAHRFIRDGAWISLLTLAEMTCVLRAAYGFSAKQIAEAIDMFTDNEDLVVQDSDTAIAALDLFRTHPKLGYSDCLMHQIAVKAGHQPLGTFDRYLAKLQGAQRL